jgi:hypothetical protein
MRGADFLAAAVVLGLALDDARAETLERRESGWSLGDIDLATPYAQRPLVPVDGPGEAFRFDGNSNWIEARDGVSVTPEDGVAVGAWLGLAAPPGDTAAIVYLGENGLLLGLNRWRQPEIRLGDLRAAGDVPLPVGEWVHLAGDFDGETLRLRVDGGIVAEAWGAAPDMIDGLFAIGRALDAGFQQGTHPLGAVNGILGEVTFRRDAAPVMPGPMPAMPPDLDAPEVWFAEDTDRPQALPIGTTGWTNEPHALIHRDGLWHLYFQANPNGAFWRDIVWGHQVSRDLATWERRHPALMPTTGFDRRGVWVGNWIPGRSPPAVLYTGVNGEWAGIGLAEADAEGSLSLARVVDFDTDPKFQDMRDPWIVRTGDEWLMLIGTGTREGREALIYTYRSKDGETWERAGLFDTGGVRIPGQYWELPVLVEIRDRWMLMGTPVVEVVPARTLYWLGDFDGHRFIPDDPEPRQLDILATYRAPTMARGPEGDLVAIGIVADEIRNEQQRHEAGWVHVLTPATMLRLCEDEPRDLCQRLAPAFADRFSRVMVETEDTQESTIPLEGRPVLLRAEIDAPEGGFLRLATRVRADGTPGAELTVDLETGVVRLDYTRGPILPLGRPPVLQGMLPMSGRVEIELIIDGAAIFGSLNGRPLAFLAFAGGEGADRLHIAAEGGARMAQLRVLALE